ncbi:MAG: hypothetical protein FWE01_01670 [Firmicutes bacterium]|nr:hypothetical protein [Bacillota bacterium]
MKRIFIKFGFIVVFAIILGAVFALPMSLNDGNNFQVVSASPEEGLKAITMSTQIRSNRQVVVTVTTSAAVDVNLFYLTGILTSIHGASYTTTNGVIYVTAGEKRIENPNDIEEYTLFSYGKRFVFSETGNNQFRLEIIFDNLQTYAYFNEIDLFLKRLVRLDGVTYLLVDDNDGVYITSGLFTRRRYVMLENPFSRMFYGTQTRMGNIFTHLQVQMNVPDGELVLVYRQDFTARRSSTNAYYSQRFIDGWRHNFVFAMDEIDIWTDLILMDRIPNTPIWYGIGIGATIIFMFGVWIVFRPRKKVFDINQPNLYSPPVQTDL